MNQSKQETHLKLTCSYSLPLLSPFLSSCSLSCFSRYSQKAPLSNQKTHYPLALPHSFSLSQNISLQSVSLKCFPLSELPHPKKKSAPLLWGPPKKNLHQKYLPGKLPTANLTLRFLFLAPQPEKPPSKNDPLECLPKLSQKKPVITETSNLPPGSFLPKLPKKLSRISHSRQWALSP